MKITSYIFLSAAFMLLAGCTVGPDYKGPPEPNYPMPDSFKGVEGEATWKAASPADSKERGEWWRVFEDSDLDGLIKEALKNNQDIKVAASRIGEAQALNKVAASDYYPHVGFDGSATRQRTSGNLPVQEAQLAGPLASSFSPGGAPLTLDSQPLSQTYNLFQAPLDLNWELDVFGRIRRENEAAQANSEAVSADAQSVSLSVAANVAISYFAIRELDAELNVLETTIQSRKKSLRIARERQEAGLVDELDVTRAEANQSNDEAQLHAVKRTRAQVEHALATLMGVPASSFDVASHPLDPGTEPPRIPVGLPSELLERRPDVAAAERELAAANAKIGVATAAFYPVFKLTGAAGFESADLSSLFAWESRMWQIGPSVHLPIFEGGRNSANLEAAKAQYAQVVGVYQGQVLIAFQEVEDALSDLRTLKDEAMALQHSVDASQRALEISQRQYKLGAVAYINVLDAERVLLQSQRASVQAQGQRLQATVRLIKSLGGGWEQ